MNSPQRGKDTNEKNEEGKLWDSLTTEQQEEVLLSYEESLDEKNLISWNEVKAKYKKWLPKK